MILKVVATVVALIAGTATAAAQTTALVGGTLIDGYLEVSPGSSCDALIMVASVTRDEP